MHVRLTIIYMTKCQAALPRSVINSHEHFSYNIQLCIYVQKVRPVFTLKCEMLVERKQEEMMPRKYLDVFFPPPERTWLLSHSPVLLRGGKVRHSKHPRRKESLCDNPRTGESPGVEREAGEHLVSSPSRQASWTHTGLSPRRPDT